MAMVSSMSMASPSQTSPSAESWGVIKSYSEAIEKNISEYFNNRFKDLERRRQSIVQRERHSTEDLGDFVHTKEADLAAVYREFNETMRTYNAIAQCNERAYMSVCKEHDLSSLVP